MPSTPQFILELFKERVELISHWFDLWTESQRNEFFDHMLSKCHNIQYAHVRNWFNERVPLQHIDFTRLLPRFLSLYIFSFLDPKSLSRTSQVSWYWKFLTEQESIWMPKCIKRGWYLPFNTNPNEYGNWKRHYITCVCTLEYILPEKNNQLNDSTDARRRKRSAAFTKYDSSGTQGSLYSIRPAWKGPDFKPKDLEKSFYAFVYGAEQNIQSTTNYKTTQPYATIYNKWRINTKENSYVKSSLNISHAVDQLSSLNTIQQPQEKIDYRSRLLLSETQAIENFNETRLRYLIEQPWEFNWDLSFYNPVQRKSNGVVNVEYSRIVLISSRIAGYELLFSATHPDVLPLIYDYEGSTVDSLRLQVEQLLSGRYVKSIGLFCHEEEPGCISLVNDCCVNLKSCRTRSDINTFFETLLCNIVSSEYGGQFDVFSSLIASENGTDLMVELKSVTNMKISSPSSVIGGPKKVLGIWLYENHEFAGCSSLNYFDKNKLNSWVNTAKLTEEAVSHCKQNLALYFDQFQQNIMYRLVGEIIFDVMGQFPTEMSRVTDVLSEALISTRNSKNQGDTLQRLTLILMEKCGLKQDTFKQMKDEPKNGILDEKIIRDDKQQNTISNSGSKINTSTGNICVNLTDTESKLFLKNKTRKTVEPNPTSGHLQENTMLRRKHILHATGKIVAPPSDKRRYIASEIINSEIDYVRMLSGFKNKYFKPLKSALESNRPIISQQNVEIIFTDILINLKLHRKLCDDLKKRYSEWEGMSTCIGDIFVIFCQNLGTYVNMVNNHEAILRCIERCREHIPIFRAFLLRNERKPEAKMLTIQEILLTPMERIEEYVYLLTALLTHTAMDHSDRPDLFKAIGSFKEVNSFIQQILTEGNRYFLKQQDVSLLKPISPAVSSDLRKKFMVCENVDGM
ncbi:epithelial cell-transforming sequence 2 oncogene-like isoform X2 [Octopus vulgaris]|uniref:Epithelial cell-transforming sequence 2 oncogene-like isoform X2 n=2 Tax=Octopus vulgaris TaxID=6645 RepID=A0AA36FGY1_OCTVU|nr:epithelial cell-transforming sequence 2 oncogene-like isoform X2 [Octopus vulgaris]